MDINELLALKDLDFDVYQQIQPLADRAVRRFGAGRSINDTDIDRMVDDVMSDRSFRRRPIPGKDDRQLRDTIRLLILISLYNTYGYNVNPFWYVYFGGIPFFLLPFLNVGRRGISWRPQRPQRPQRPPVRPPARPPSGPPQQPPARPPSGPPQRPSQGGHPPRPPTGGNRPRPPSGGSRPRPPSRSRSR